MKEKLEKIEVSKFNLIFSEMFVFFANILIRQPFLSYFSTSYTALIVYRAPQVTKSPMHSLYVHTLHRPSRPKQRMVATRNLQLGNLFTTVLAAPYTIKCFRSVEEYDRRRDRFLSGGGERRGSRGDVEGDGGAGQRDGG